MFGNLINSRQIKSLLKAKTIEIEPFDVSYLSTVHYTLHANKIKERLANGQTHTVWNFSENDNPYTLKAGNYVIIEILEKIKLNDENIIGHFIPTSNLIDEGILLVAGKIDKKYGNTGHQMGRQTEMINFGLKNLTNSDVLISPNHRLSHMELFDLRGVSSEKIKLSDEDIKRRVARALRDIEDGVDYGDGDE